MNEKPSKIAINLSRRAVNIIDGIRGTFLTINDSHQPIPESFSDILTRLENAVSELVEISTKADNFAIEHGYETKTPSWRVGDFNFGLSVFVNENDDGDVPHFHVITNPNVDTETRTYIKLYGVAGGCVTMPFCTVYHNEKNDDVKFLYDSKDGE